MSGEKQAQIHRPCKTACFEDVASHGSRAGHMLGDPIEHGTRYLGSFSSDAFSLLSSVVAASQEQLPAVWLTSIFFLLWQVVFVFAFCF
jgi:hypothetical protein